MSIPNIRTISGGDDPIGFRNIKGELIGTVGSENDVLVIRGTSDGTTVDRDVRVQSLTPSQQSNLQSEIIVTKASDFDNVDSTKIYTLDGIIDMGSTSIIVPPTGITIKGGSFDVCGLTSSEDNYTMFVSESIPIGSGNVLGMDYFVTTSGVGSKVYELYDATGFNAFEFQRINYIDCTSLGDLYDYRQGLESGTGRFGGSPSLTLHGLWLGGFRITTSIVRSLAGTMTEPLFKSGTAFQMNSRFLTDINCDLPTLAPLLDFSPSNFPNPGTVQLQGCEITRDGTYNAEDTNITPNVTQGDLCSYWKRNNGLPSTFVGGVGLLLLEQDTTITVQGQFELLNASAWLGNDLQHFEISADGKLKHLGNSPREFEITYNLNLDSQQNNEIYIKYYKYDASTSTEIPLDYTIQARQVNNLVGGRDVAFFVGTIGVTLDQGDEIYIKVMNNSSTTDITGENGSYFRLQER